MAAEAILGPFVQVAVEKLLTLAKDEVGSMLGVHEDIRQLRNKLRLLQGLLRDAEKKEQTSDLVKEWLRMLNDVAFDADDVLDEFATVALKRRIQTSERKQVCNLLSCATPRNILFQRKMSRKIKVIRVKVDAIEKNKPDLQLIIGESGQKMQPEPKRQRETGSLVDQSHIFGRQEERKRLRELLVCDEVREKDVSVIPIVGIGGMGKTTLAQLVYNDENIKKEFGLKLWICVSEDFDVKRLIREIIYSATKRRCDSEQLDAFQRELKEILSRERFLLVLDDVWNDKSDEWEKLRVSLIDGQKGSAVVVTTRNESVSTLMGTVPFIKLGGLSEEDCLSLFNQRAFGEGPNRYPELKDIGKEIVRKCKGLTLAVKTLGGMLATKRDAREWRKILDSEVWDSKGSDEIIPILKLSYNHLSSSYLKQCFAYCSLFPKDHNFDSTEMIRLWMGEGLIQPKDGEQFEDTGHEYFNELVSIGFLEFSGPVVNVPFDYFRAYKMHDLVHDLAQFVAKGVYVTNFFDKSSVTFENAHHFLVDLKSSENPVDFGFLFNCKSARTILLTHSTFHSRTTQPIPHELFFKLRCLRVLDLRGVNIEMLPDSMGKLKHLRYLNLSYTKIRQLPQSVTTLFNLQTLLFDDCYYLLNFPKDTKNLINLRHLSGSELSDSPPEIGKLTSLQTLTSFVVGKTSGNGIEQLKNLVNLRILSITRLGNVVNGEMAKEADLKKKQHLNCLSLSWTAEGSDIGNDDEGILEALQPHSNLKILGIFYYRGSSFPGWISNSSLLSNLVSLSLSSCDRCSRLPALGQLRSLKELEILDFDGVEHVGREFVGKMTGFLSLKKLTFYGMKNLKEWSGVEDGDFPKLRELEFINCPKLSTVPKQFESIMHIKRGCPLLKIS